MTAAKRDVVLLFTTRFARMFAYGLVSIILVLYLTQIGFDERTSGLLMSLTLAGDMLISLWMTTRADRIGRRKMLIAGAVQQQAEFRVTDGEPGFRIDLHHKDMGIVTAAARFNATHPAGDGQVEHALLGLELLVGRPLRKVLGLGVVVVDADRGQWHRAAGVSDELRFVLPEDALTRWRDGRALLHPPTHNAFVACALSEEEEMLARLREHRKQRFEPTLARHGGRLVKLTGDGALAEFSSAVDALSAAIA